LVRRPTQFRGSSFDRARALGISRSDLAGRFGYQDIGKGHKALSATLTTGKVPPHMAKHLPDARETDDALVDAVMAATSQQQEDEWRSKVLARETAYRAAFTPHLRTETARAIPEPIFVAARLRLVEGTGFRSATRGWRRVVPPGMHFTQPPSQSVPASQAPHP
jgi:hypothetical protein